MSNKLIKPWAHEICREAVRCVEICEKDPRYKIMMMTWHDPQTDGSCNVCAAGAWMAVALKIPISLYMAPPGLGGDGRKIAFAMSRLQFGEIKHGLEILGQVSYYRNTVMRRWNEETYYGVDPAQWKEGLLAIADYLEENFLGEEEKEEQVAHKESVQKVEA